MEVGVEGRGVYAADKAEEGGLQEAETLRSLEEARDENHWDGEGGDKIVISCGWSSVRRC